MDKAFCLGSAVDDEDAADEDAADDDDDDDDDVVVVVVLSPDFAEEGDAGDDSDYQRFLINLSFLFKQEIPVHYITFTFRCQAWHAPPNIYTLSQS